MNTYATYLAAINKMGETLPDELITIILQYVTLHNLQNIIDKIKLDFPGLKEFLHMHKGEIVGKCLLDCLNNKKLPTAIKIIVPVTDLDQIGHLVKEFRNLFTKYSNVTGIRRGMKSKSLYYAYKHLFFIYDIVISLKFSLTDNYLTRCYGISGDRTTFNGKEFNFPISNLRQFIIDKPITVSSRPQSFLSVARQCFAEHYSISVEPEAVPPSTFSRVDFNNLCQLYNKEEKSLAIRLITKCMNTSSGASTTDKYLHKIAKYLADGYRITNIGELECLIVKLSLNTLW